MNCAALIELAIPPSLRYIGSRAFLDCTALKRLAKMPGKHKWRGVYAEENAFAICPDMGWPPWLHMIPDMGYTLLSNYIILLVGVDCTLDWVSKDLQGIHMHKLQFTP